MFQWAHFRNEPQRASAKEQAFEVVNVMFRKFFTTSSWFVYFFALFFLVLGVVYFFIDESRKRHLLERRRAIRRAQERPPQKRRPGAIARNHEIYRTIMGKVKEYIEPNINQPCVFRQTRSGTIYGHLIDSDKSSINHLQEQREQSDDKENELLDVERTLSQQVVFY